MQLYTSNTNELEGINMGKLNWLSQNAKMKKIKQYDVYNWGIPAFRSQTGTVTCPMAGVCASGCYAQSGAYRFGNVKTKYESRLELSQTEAFVPTLLAEIEQVKATASKRGKQCLIRIHDSGDFYSVQYINKWLEIIQSQPDTLFYAYTKQVSQFKALDIPKNLILIYSYGGRQDDLIDPERDRHSQVFQYEAELASQGYSDASQDDMVALGDNLKIGLVFHHSKNYANTKWSKQNVPK
jgi:hypothetical protein